MEQALLCSGVSKEALRHLRVPNVIGKRKEDQVHPGGLRLLQAAALELLLLLRRGGTAGQGTEEP